MSELKDLLEEVSVEYLERERDRLYALQQQVSVALGEVKTELMRRALAKGSEDAA